MDEPRDTRPAFPGDDRDAFREKLLRYRAGTLDRIADAIGKWCLRASVATGREDDPIVLALTAGPTDPKPLAPVCAHLAAWWRLANGQATAAPETGDPLVDYLEHGLDRDEWIHDEVTAWFLDAPELLRLAALLLARPPSAQPPAVERELREALQRRYPLPPPERPDLAGDPRP